MSYYQNNYPTDLTRFAERAKSIDNKSCTNNRGRYEFTRAIMETGSIEVVDEKDRTRFVICFILELQLDRIIQKHFISVYDEFVQATGCPTCVDMQSGKNRPYYPYAFLFLLPGSQWRILEEWNDLEKNREYYTEVSSIISEFLLEQRKRFASSEYGKFISFDKVLDLIINKRFGPISPFEGHVRRIAKIVRDEQEYSKSRGQKDNGVWIFAGILGVGWGIVSLLWQVPSMHELGRGFGELWLLVSLVFPWLLMTKAQDYVKDPFGERFVVFTIGLLFLVLVVIGALLFGW